MESLVFLGIGHLLKAPYAASLVKAGVATAPRHLQVFLLFTRKKGSTTPIISFAAVSLVVGIRFCGRVGDAVVCECEVSGVFMCCSGGCFLSCFSAFSVVCVREVPSSIKFQSWVFPCILEVGSRRVNQSISFACQPCFD